MLCCVVAATASGTTGLPPGSRAEGNRGAILVAGLDCFAEVGYHAASIRDIAAGAGLRSASLYSHFESKEAILAELVEIGHRELHQHLLEALVAAGPDPRDQLASLVSAHVATHLEYPRLALVANGELKNLSSAAASPSVAMRQGATAMLIEVLERGVREGCFDVSHFPSTVAVLATLGASFARVYPDHVDGTTANELATSSAVLALRMVGVADWEVG